jgi:hypothetical protein
LLIDLAALVRIKVPGFAHHGFGDPLVERSINELGIRVGEFEPQRSRGAQPTRRRRRRDLAGQPNLFGDAAADRLRMDLRRHLLSHLRLREPDRFGRLQRRRGRPQLL